MYTNGFTAAVIVGLMALAAPALWIAWWMIADLGDRVNGSPRETARPGLQHAR